VVARTELERAFDAIQAGDDLRGDVEIRVRGRLAQPVLKAGPGVAAAAEYTHHRAAMVVSPAGAVRGEGIGLIAPVAVDRRRGEHGARRGVLEQAGEIGLTEVGKELRSGEQVAAVAVDQRLVQVPAARGVALERRPRHEGGEAAKPAADLPRGRAKEQ